MAKKESKKPEKVKQPKDKSGKSGKKKSKKGDAPAADANQPTGAPAGVPSTGIPSTGTPSTGTTANGVPTTGTASVPLANLSPEQMTAAQIEQAIKESNDPESRLKKLRSPINVRSCLLNILFLIIMTLAIVVIWCAIEVDKFNFVTVVKDMSSQFGITQGFQWLWSTISGWFS
ncbi:MAG: hypothetical protein NC184_00200 [Roseburia sp.]|nr:hypothetical protein [Roseburia sp.]